MKKQFSLSKLMHNEKLMMLASFVLAVLIWSLVVFGPSNAQDQVITGVPISVTLNDYATQTLNLRITSGANATATVTVHGLRSVVSKLSAADITVTADTGNVIKEGTYTLQLRAVSSGDYTITKVVGDDGNNDTVTVTCDVWKEATVPVEVEMNNIALEDEKTLQFGTPLINSEAVTDGNIIVAGPKTEINRISKVVAIIEDAEVISEATAYEARLEARDDQGSLITGVTFNGIEDSMVNVTVPVMVYRKVELTPMLLHTPAAYRNRDGLISVSPKTVELWGVPSELDDYINSIQSMLQLDFDQLSASNLTQNIALQTVDGIRPVNGSETIQVKVGLSGITSKTYSVDINADNFNVANCPEGYTVKPKQNKIADITLCGTAKTLNKIKSDDIILLLDMENAAAVGQQTMKARIAVRGQGGVWAYYGEAAHGVDVLVSVEQ